MEIPLIGLGTWLLQGKECEKVVKMAIDIGYRHIDTAFAYENHKEVGKAIKGWDREKLFLTTKLGIGFSQVDDASVERSVEKACDLALKELDTDYIDLFLIHWPDRKRPLEEILAALHKMVEKGKVCNPGVSNYTEHHLQDAYDVGLQVPFNQVELHPYLNQEKLRVFCDKHGTKLIAFRPFGKGLLLREESLFDEIGKGYGKTGAQVILRWITEKGIPVIVKGSSRMHLSENFNCLDFDLTPQDLDQINLLNKDFRYCSKEWSEFDY